MKFVTLINFLPFHPQNRSICNKKGMSKLTNAQKKEWAKTLYIQGGLTQKEIADKVDVSRVTMNKWVNDTEENWDKLKKSLLITRESQLSRLYMQLDELNTSIMSRDQGARFANSKEADTINKLTTAIRKMEIEASIADIVEVGKRFLTWLRPLAPDKAKEVAPLFDDFIKDSLKR